MTRPYITGLVLAAGASRRLGQPKQLLPFGAGSLLDHALGVARRCAFDQTLCVIGGGGPDIRDQVDLRGFTVVENVAYGEGCSSSIVAALGAVDPRATALVLMLGDQPGVTPSIVSALIAGRGDASLAACRYENGRGHPFAFSRSAFGDLAALHGDKGVWKLMDRAGAGVTDVPVSGTVPLDVDTWEDYASVLAGARRSPT